MTLVRHFIAAVLLTAAMKLANAYSLDDESNGWRPINDDDPAITYSADFARSINPLYLEGDLHAARTIGASCTLAFTGTGVKWIGGRNSDHGEADVYLDGKLDKTISTAAPNWLKIQELYSRTGLSNGPHTLKIQIKTDAYQDVDAFQILAPPPLTNLGHMQLPALVPFLNESHRYPVGSGVGMAVSEPTGEWRMLYGPGYTSSNLIRSEKIELEIDGVERPLDVSMHRLQKTGIYSGIRFYGDLTVRLIDYTSEGAPWISRLIRIDNESSTAAHDVRLRAIIAPFFQSSITQSFVRDARQRRRGVSLNAGPDGHEPNGQKNYENKTVVIAFSDPLATAFQSVDIVTLETALAHLAPKSSCNISLCHYFKRDARSDAQYLDAIDKLDPVAELENSITEWQTWFDHVPAGFRLGKITDKRAHDLVEGALTILRTNQCFDGGIIAHSTYYLEGYIRDAALCLRGLTATGHFDESKKWLKWVDKNLPIAGRLNDSWPCGSPMPPSSGDDPYATNVEEPGHILITARDYLAATHDLDFLNSIQKTLQFCMDVQLKEAIANDGKMSFNGDETEICWAVNADASGFHRDQWSLSSVAICAASLDFYIRYLKLRHEDPAKYACTKTGTTLDLNAELAALIQAMDRDFWRTNLPEFPGGFHDFSRGRDGSWPSDRIVNFSLMPVYFGTPYDSAEKVKDVVAIAHYFDPKTGFLQLVPGANTGFDGHDLGYLLWDLIETNNPLKDDVYHALVDGSTPDCWGSFNEAYDKNGRPNDHDLRSLETGVNISAIAKYWGLGLRDK
jgi:hypothetical protein